MTPAAFFHGGPVNGRRIRQSILSGVEEWARPSNGA